MSKDEALYYLMRWRDHYWRSHLLHLKYNNRTVADECKWNSIGMQMAIDILKAQVEPKTEGAYEDSYKKYNFGEYPDWILTR